MLIVALITKYISWLIEHALYEIMPVFFSVFKSPNLKRRAILVAISGHGSSSTLPPLLLLLLSPRVCVGGSAHGKSNSSADGSKRSCAEKVKCQPGILLPVWLPQDPSLAMQSVRAMIYFASLLYMFLGVSIIADRFMAAIEVITSQVHSNTKWHNDRWMDG